MFLLVSEGNTTKWLLQYNQHTTKKAVSHEWQLEGQLSSLFSFPSLCQFKGFKQNKNKNKQTNKQTNRNLPWEQKKSEQPHPQAAKHQIRKTIVQIDFSLARDVKTRGRASINTSMLKGKLQKTCILSKRNCRPGYLGYEYGGDSYSTIFCFSLHQKLF